MIAAALFAMVVSAPSDPAPSAPFAIVAGKILTVTQGTVDNGVILVRGSKIEKVGPRSEVPIPDGYETIDVGRSWVTPGFVDLHCHIASEGEDLNDTVFQINTDLRTLDVIRPENELLKDAVAGGVTTVLFIPGSGTNLSGFGTLLKTAGRTLEECVIRFPGAMKIAQAGNPERGSDFGSGRIGMNWMIRNILQEGKEYHEAWSAFEAGRTSVKPARNLRLELMRGLFRHEFPILVHTQIMQVVQSTRRILIDEFGLWVVVSHAEFDGYKNAPDFAARNAFINAGPRNYWFDTSERRFLGLAKAWWDGGCHNLSLNTDSPVVAEEELFVQAAVAVRFGLDREVALRALTIEPAKAIGIAERCGSIEAGKDADLVVRTGDPLDPRNPVEMTFVNGKLAYDRKRDGRRF
ncbi:MAG: amidohydrolase family protein [Planctomycetes bacterium]|nr:amidohydrolase family protein [Planctomycetota bacterium]MBI3843076.1 amidohydrolase family protein [Planctomycetota bacterium]